MLLERLVKHVTSLYLVEPDRQGTYVRVLGPVINTWAARRTLLPESEAAPRLRAFRGTESTSFHRIWFPVAVEVKWKVHVSYFVKTQIHTRGVI